ncbi:FAD-binding oxidoreductase [Acidimicrobiaceae bacterium]|nr:FAD-binding oxidoreductase [Acidimicrobiaceae bacterium]
MKVREKPVGKSSSHKSQTSDVVVIGAGIIGLAIAYSLLRAGKSVRIIERSKPGIGQSTKTGGGIRLAHGSELNIQLTQLSFDTWLNFEKYFNIDPFYRTTGHLFLTAESENVLLSQAALLERMKVDYDLLSTSQMSSYWPQLSSMNFSKGLYCREGGYLDQHRVIKGYVDTVVSNGVKLLTGTQVDGLLKVNERISGVTTSAGKFHAEWVVNAAGPYAGEVADLVGCQIPFVSRRHELLVLEESAAVPEEIPWLIDMDRQVHMRPDGSGRALIGGFLGHDEATDPNTYDPELSEEWSKEVRREASNSFCITNPESKVLKGWSGLYPGTVDYMPVIDETLPGLVTAAGFSGTGLMHAPVVGEIVADLISSSKRHHVDISSLSSTRFTKDSQILESTGF